MAQSKSKMTIWGRPGRVCLFYGR